MIIEFSVGNFRSIKDVETLSMVASPKVSANKELDVKNVHHVGDKLTLLKSKAIYGANASGKSNMVKAFDAFKDIVSESVKDDDILMKVIEPFKLSTETKDSPSFFQLLFLLKGVQYRYGFEVSKRKVHSEWLFGKPGTKEVKFFVRDDRQISFNPNQFKEAEFVVKLFGGKTEHEIGRENVLFLSAAKTIVQGLAKEISDYVSGVTTFGTGMFDFELHVTGSNYMRSESSIPKALQLLQTADIGIQNVAIKEFSDKGKTNNFLLSVKKVFDEYLNPVDDENFFFVMEESEGTKRMLRLGLEVVECLRSGRPLIIDEFDARFHPELTKRLVELMNSYANKKGQVIFVTHDTNLLDADLLRRDQICLVEKDKYGASHFYTLADFKGVRNDAQFEKDYLAGRYGAIPLLGDFESLLED
jgi:AAA15 family ATPase/GTPase